MINTENKEDNSQRDDQGNNKPIENREIIGKIYLKKPEELKSVSKNSNNDVQRAIEGLKEIPDEELQDFLDDKEFMEELDVLDAWEEDKNVGDEEKTWEKEQNSVESTRQKKKRSSRERHHPESKGSSSREKPKREEKKREETRRDPSKSMKDIEKDKIKARNTQNKLLAEKEKAIKNLLDSDNVVPPGTEAEAIQSIKEEQNKERSQREAQRNRERRRSIDRHIDRYDKLSPQRRRTPERYRLSPASRRRSPFIRLSPDRRSVERYRSPFRYNSPNRWKLSPRSFHERRTPVLSPDRRRSPRRSSRERRSSVDRRWSVERHRRRADVFERRRSRSRDRSRSTDRMRSRSRDRRSRSMERPRRRTSRSPMSRRYNRRTRSRTRSPEKRGRRRSPFINELRRKLKEEAMLPSDTNSSVYAPPKMEGRSSLLSTPVFKEDPMSQPSVMPSSYMHQSGPHQPPQPSQPPPPPPPPPASVPPMPTGPPFMNFEPMSGVSPMNFEPMPPHPLPQMANPIVEYSSGPVLYNQQTAVPTQPPIPPGGVGPSMLSAPLPTPQPVPAPIMDNRGQMPYNASHEASSARRSPSRQFEPSNKPMSHSTASMSQSYPERGPSRNEFRASRMERMKTPEPPIISKPKQSEKTSLSSLLEASVSAKDPSNIPVLYPGFKPEIMRHCEQALCQLPFEDPRLKMKGRFFYCRDEDNETQAKDDTEDHMSNSILLQKSKTKIYWEENNTEQIPVPKTTAQTHQKICQTDAVETEAKGVQAGYTAIMVDSETQVYPHDLQPIKEEKRSIMDRLDWGGQRETYDYAPGSRFREVEDLRHSLSNSSQRRSWNRPASPRRSEDHEHRLDTDDASRNYRLDSPVRNRDGFSSHKARDHYIHTARTPEYHARSVERDDFHDRRSEHSRGESPMELDSDDEYLDEHTFQRGGSDWHGRGTRGKSHVQRGKHVGGGRSYRGNRGNFRGKF